MHNDLLSFIREHCLSPFSDGMPRSKGIKSIFKTPDARAVHARVINHLSRYFKFPATSCLFNAFTFAENSDAILSRQKFFSSIPLDILPLFENISSPKPWWRPKYGIVVVTEDESTFMNLSRLGCPVQFLATPEDLASLQSYEIVQAIDCEQFRLMLERIPQTIFLDSLDAVYLERYLSLLSGWEQILLTLSSRTLPAEMRAIVDELCSLLPLLHDSSEKPITLDDANQILGEVNQAIGERLAGMTLPGSVFLSLLQKGALPQALHSIVREELLLKPLPLHVFTLCVPLSFDERALHDFIADQYARHNTSFASRVVHASSALQSVPERLDLLSRHLILHDFVAGMAFFMKKTTSFPVPGDEFVIEDACNIFLDDAQPVSFQLIPPIRCSILTGANSGGKTTLLEHLIQIVTLFHIGLPISGKASVPFFTEIYYFAKPRGSANRGAFETLLTDLSAIAPSERTLILADEIEAVTEPGVAGTIVSATASYFIERGCFLVVATHLGQEVQAVLPKGARIDGIEAKGLTENLELIVDHNPVLGRLAHSTPELIVERLARSHSGDYFMHIHKSLTAKNQK